MTYNFRSLTVLVIENTQPMSDLTKDVLKSFGISSVLTTIGPDAGFEAFCRAKPDLVIIDWLEGPVTGVDLTKRMRLDPRSPNTFVPILLMTGFSQKTRVERARDSGITEFLVKPFTAKALYQKIEYMIEKPRLFVLNDAYFGPDRRRKTDNDFNAKDRRSHEKKEKIFVSEKDAEMIKSLNKEAAERVS
jgi:two-component system chemotaxis response regulator CheY